MRDMNSGAGVRQSMTHRMAAERTCLPRAWLSVVKAKEAWEIELCRMDAKVIRFKTCYSLIHCHPSPHRYLFKSQ